MTKTRLTLLALSLAMTAVAAGTASSVTVAQGSGARAGAGGSNPQPACSDMVDNDGDLAIDMADPGCADPLDTNETAAPPAAAGPGAGPPAPANLLPGEGKPAQEGGGSAKKDKLPKPPPKGNLAPLDHSEPTIVQFEPAPIGVPNFIIDRFEIPPFLLPIYQACGTEYGIPWQVLASINRIETAFGTNLNVSSAGALGWMQFIPSSWRAYGVDANDDGHKDPYNPVDAICAAARYLNAAGGEHDLRGAIFAYNHADWYVDEVLLYADEYAKLPDDLIGSLTGLTEGAHFPVAAESRYAGELSERRAVRRSNVRRRTAGNAADVTASSPTRREINIFARRNAPVVAVNDGVVERIGVSGRLGNFIVLRGGYSLFDNMKQFFGGNGYTVIDRSAIARENVSHETIWGVADEDLFRQAIREMDARTAAGRKVFAHVMTTSNHRPFTYPAGRIDVPSGSGRAGAVKYADWAIGEMMREAAKRPWFKDTLFVFVADHTSNGRGRTDLPPENYRIPLIFYAPGLVTPRVLDWVASQIDVGPTILALLNVSYTSRFFGHDILTDGRLHQRAFMANYLTVGYMEDGLVVELAPKRRVRVMDASTGRPVSKDDPKAAHLIAEAIAHYQIATMILRGPPPD